MLQVLCRSCPHDDSCAAFPSAENGKRGAGEDAAVAEGEEKLPTIRKLPSITPLKNTLGLSAFNAKKRRDQAASEVRKATAINDKPRQISEFLSWRASLEGRKYDTAPQGDRVNVLFAPFAFRGVSIKHLGYASRYTLKHLLRSMY